MNRMDFIKRISSVAVVGIPIVTLMNSCTSSVNPVTAPAVDQNCLENGTNSNIASNHGHTLTVSKSDVSQGSAKTYNIQGSASHTHEVTISQANFTALRDSNTAIQVSSTSGSGHTHSVSVSCV